MKILSLRANHFTEPLGNDLSDLSLSWVVESDAAKKAVSSRVVIARDAAFKQILSDSGHAQLDSLAYHPELELQPYTRYYWSVAVEGDNGEKASAKSFFETGKMDESWAGKWISNGNSEREPHFIVRKKFRADKSAGVRLYAAALGMYEATINGKPVTDELLLPGYHSYTIESHSQVFDISPLLSETGTNEIAFHVGCGWYRSKLACWQPDTPCYGKATAIMAEIRDSGKLLVKTDASWQVAKSPVTESEIYYGEDYDQNREELKSSDWKKASLFTPAKGDFGVVRDRLSPPVRRIEKLTPKVITTPAGETVLDFGQNITGWVEVFNRMPAGAIWSLDAAEILNAEGNFYRDNLRQARAMFRFTSAGREAWVRPHFTFFGFRYMRLQGWSGKVSPKDFVAWAIHSDLGFTGNITTGNKLLNRFFLNALWSQRDNFLDLPTDCPQRDERLGWTGDAQAFSGTASFNMYTPAFFMKYINDMMLEQKLFDGGVPFVVPTVRHWLNLRKSHSSAAWGDAATIVPWNVYEYFGDKSMLRKMYPAMKMWVDYIRRQDDADGGKRLWQTGFHFADWLALDNYRDPASSFGGTDPHYVASAYYSYSTELTVRAAEVLGEYRDAEHYRKQLAEIKAAIQREYFSPSGRCVVDTQTAYVVALAMDLVPDQWRKRCADILASKVMSYDDGRLETGFVGTYFLCRVLSDNGHPEVAYKLLLREKCPGWLYEVIYGATTVWERWNGQGPMSRPADVHMNSFNHYAYGAVIEWVYRGVCGINPDPAQPGFRHISLRPIPSKDLGEASCIFDSPCGRYESAWKYKGDKVSYTFRIPFGCTATLTLPDRDPVELTAGIYRF